MIDGDTPNLPQGVDTDALFEGVVASAPDADGKVYVTIPEFDPDLRHGPCPYMPRGDAKPARGDRCLVVFADGRQPWVAAWDGPTPDLATQIGLDAVQADIDAHEALTTSAHGGIVASTDARLTDARTPTGAAGGDLGGTFPNPKVDSLFGAGLGSSSPWTQAGGLMTDALELPAVPSVSYPQNRRRWIRTTNTPAGGTGPKRLSLFWLNRDSANWQPGGPIIVEVFTTYYGGGGYTKSVVSGGYSTPLRLDVVASHGSQPYRPTLGAEAVYSGNFSEAQVYLDLPDYVQALVCVTYAHRSETTRPFTTLTGQMAFDVTFTQAGAGQTIDRTFISDAQVVAGNKDGAAGTPSMRTLGTGASQAAPGNDSRFYEAGDIKASARATPSTGWLLCDGSAVSRTTYATLYAALGSGSSPYGQGDGSTTFNLPDLRGRVPVGEDGSAGRMTANDARGQAGGEEKHTLSTSEMPSHNHGGATGGMSANNPHSHFYGDDTVAAFPTIGLAGGGDAGGVTNIKGTNTTDIAHTHAISSEGGGGAHNNMQPYQVVNYFIKT